MHTIISKTITYVFVLVTINMDGQLIDISNEEMNDMVEQVARDVYEYLDEIWDLRVFNTIKQSPDEKN